MPQSQTAALPRPQEEEETDKPKQKQTEQTHEKHQDQTPLPKRGNRNTKRTEKHKNKTTHGKTHNKSPRRINHKATRSKTNTGTTAPERQEEQTTGGLKAPPQPANPTRVPTLLSIHKHTKPRPAQRPPTQPTHQSENIKIKLITIINKDEHAWPTPPHARANENQQLNHGGPSQRHTVKCQPTC